MTIYPSHPTDLLKGLTSLQLTSPDSTGIPGRSRGGGDVNFFSEHFQNFCRILPMKIHVFIRYDT